MSSSGSTAPKQGTKLRYPLYGPNGMLLLAAGSAVTPHLRSLLDRRGIHLEFQCSLEVLEGQSVGTKIPIKQDLVTIGRGAQCEIRPDSKVVSSRHCQIHKRAFGVFLVDCQSTNGTFLNGQRVTQETELTNGDRIRAADILFGVELFAAVAIEDDDASAALMKWVLSDHGAQGEPAAPMDGPTVTVTDSAIRAALRLDSKESLDEG